MEVAVAFGVRRVIREVPKARLREYFEARGAEIDHSWWKRSEPKLATALAEYLVARSDAVRRRILADLVRIDPLSNEKGHRAVLNAASHDEKIVAALAAMANHHERSLWILLHHEDTFREAEELLFFDHYSEGARARHFRTQPDRPVSRGRDDVAKFQDSICRYFRRKEGSGASCHVEFVDREAEGSTQVTIYVEGLPDHVMEFVEQNFRRRISFPAKEAAVVYEPTLGKVSTVVRGGRAAHELLREAFARCLLKIEPKFDALIPQPFRLDELAKAPTLAPEPELGVTSARVRKLKLAPRSHDKGSLVLEAPAGKPEISAFDLANLWLKGGSSACRKFSVLHATIALHLAPVPGRAKARTINVELTKPNTSNLKDMSEADRAIAEAHIEKWQLWERLAA
jgi:hypothetical protein